mgnify:CR=1 FL=1
MRTISFMADFLEGALASVVRFHHIISADTSLSVMLPECKGTMTGVVDDGSHGKISIVEPENSVELDACFSGLLTGEPFLTVSSEDEDVKCMHRVFWSLKPKDTGKK